MWKTETKTNWKIDLEENGNHLGRRKCKKTKQNPAINIPRVTRNYIVCIKQKRM